mgnify:FL=1|jgi:anti-anti-sigma factor
MATQIEKIDGKTIVKVEERIDTISAMSFEKTINPIIMEPNSDIVFDCSNLQYVASSGLRVILKAQKIVSMQGGKLKLVSVIPAVKKVFDMTGFTKFLAIECRE